MKKDFDGDRQKRMIGANPNKKINIKLFNEIYEKNKLFDPYDMNLWFGLIKINYQMMNQRNYFLVDLVAKYLIRYLMKRRRK